MRTANLNRAQQAEALLSVPHPRRPHRQTRVHVRSDLRSTIDQAVTYGALGASATAALLALFTVKRGRSTATGNQDEDGMRWAVMGVVGCLPLFNWLAWVLAALEDDKRARQYYWFAALYALPLVRNGFDVDWFTWALLVAGVAHIQLERIAITEPEVQASLARQLQPLGAVRKATLAAGSALTAAFGLGGREPAQLPPPGTGLRRWWWEIDATQQAEAEATHSFEEEELRRFDRELEQREAARRRGGCPR